MRKLIFLTLLLCSQLGNSQTFTISGKLYGDVSVSYNVKGYDKELGGDLESSTVSEINTGKYSLVCNIGDTIRRIEITNLAGSFVNRMTNFIGWYRDCIVDIDVPLPIVLDYFKVKVIGNSVELKWKTSFELNNFGFEIWRNNSKCGFAFGENIPSVYTFLDKNLQVGQYKYKIRQFDFNGNFEDFVPTIGDIEISVPTACELFQNYPNPFNSETCITFTSNKYRWIGIIIYDIQGREVKRLVDGYYDVGYYSVMFNGNDLSSGTYVCMLKTNNFFIHKTMMIIK